MTTRNQDFATSVEDSREFVTQNEKTDMPRFRKHSTLFVKFHDKSINCTPVLYGNKDHLVVSEWTDLETRSYDLAEQMLEAYLHNISPQAICLCQ